MDHDIADPITGPLVRPSDGRPDLDPIGHATVYQPIVHLESGLTIGAAAMSDSTGRDSIETVDEAHRVHDGGAHVASELEATSRCVRQRHRWPTSWSTVSINVSDAALADPRLTGRLEAAGPRVMVDVAARRSADPTTLERAVGRLRDGGVRIALDGWRFTELDDMLFERLRPDTVKLGVESVSALQEPAWSATAFERLVARCRRSGALLVAVSVETSWQRDALSDLGVEAAQGPLFGPPEPIEAHSMHVDALGWIDVLGISGRWNPDWSTASRGPASPHRPVARADDLPSAAPPSSVAGRRGVRRATTTERTASPETLEANVRGVPA